MTSSKILMIMKLTNVQCDINENEKIIVKK